MTGAVPFGIGGEGLEDENEVTGEIVDSALRVHRKLGPGLLERLYVNCLETELEERGLATEREVSLGVSYRGKPHGLGYRADLVVAGMVIVEAKSCSDLRPVHKAQLDTYLRLADIPVGLLVNFNVEKLRDGIVRRVVT